MSYTCFRRHLSRILFGGGVLFCFGSAEAQQSRRFDLTWNAPTGCPDSGAVAREIDELVAGSSLAPGQSMIAASASVAADRDGFTLVLTIRDAEGIHQRRLEAPTCEELGHAAALIVALAIDPALLATHSDPGGASPNAAQARPAIEPRPRPTPSYPAFPMTTGAQPQLPAVSAATPSTVATEPLPWRLGLVEFVAWRTLPGINLGTGLFGAIQTKMFRFEGVVSGLRGEAEKADKPSVGATFVLYRFAPKACWLVAEKKWAIGPCVGVELGTVRGRGYGVDNSSASNGYWFASTFGALFELRLTSSSLLGVTADAEVPWVRDQFTLYVRDQSTLIKTVLFEPQVSARLGVSLSAGW